MSRLWMTNTNKRGLYGNFNNVDHNQTYNNSYLFIKQFNPDMDIIHFRKKSLKPLKARIRLVKHKCNRRRRLIKKYFGSKSNSKSNSNSNSNSNSRCKSNHHKYPNYQHWRRYIKN